jgi:phage tail sheath gpL-like
MSALIPITGVAIDFRVPGAFAEILFAQGPASAAAGEREVVFVMPMLATGTTWTANALIRVNNSGEAETGAGAGSPIHRAIRKYLTHNKDSKVWALPYLPSSGGSPVAATGVITFTFSSGSNPTATGTATVTICGEDCTYTYKTTDTLTTIAAGLKAAINAKPHLPVSADNSAGVLTLTAKIMGVSQGNGTVGVIRFRSTVTAGTNAVVATSGAALGLGTGVAGADGTTTEATRLTTALAVLDAVRKYYVGVSVNDATSLGAVKTHIVNKSEPRRGLRSRAIAAFTGTGAAGATIATGRNYERLQMFWQEASEHDNAEIVGALMAIVQKEESKDATCNLAGYSLSDILLPVFDAADRPDDTEQNDAINDGLSPIATNEVGPYLVMHVNTRSKNSAGTQDDFRATEAHRVSGCDLFVDTVLANWALQYAARKFEDDERLADRKFNPSQGQRPNVVRPSNIDRWLKSQLEDFWNLGHSQELQASKDSVRCLKNGSRNEASLDLHIIDHLLQGTFRVAEVSPG